MRLARSPFATSRQRLQDFWPNLVGKRLGCCQMLANFMQGLSQTGAISSLWQMESPVLTALHTGPLCPHSRTVGFFWPHWHLDMHAPSVPSGSGEVGAEARLRRVGSCIQRHYQNFCSVGHAPREGLFPQARNVQHKAMMCAEGRCFESLATGLKMHCAYRAVVSR